MNESEIRDLATRRVTAKREFKEHLQVFVAVNLLLNVIWAVTSFGDYYWPVWPLMGWGIGLFFHGYGVYRYQPIRDDETDREMELLRRSTSQTHR